MFRDVLAILGEETSKDEARFTVMAVAEVLVPNAMYHSNEYSLFTSSRRNSESDGGYATPGVVSTDDERESSPQPSLTTVPLEQLSSNFVQPESSADSVQLRERIVKQVEWYFSDENLVRDSFLMKHINRNKKGFVSLKLVASLRKVKAITKEWKVVQTEIKHSQLLELNEDGTKIRRVSPVPQIDYSNLPRTVIVTKYPHPAPEEEAIKEEFGRFGTVTRVMVLHPSKSIPLNVKSCRSKHPEIGKELCILVEYSTVAAANTACAELSQAHNWRQTMTVRMITRESDDASDKPATEERPANPKKEDATVSKKSRNEKGEAKLPAKNSKAKVSLMEPPVGKGQRMRSSKDACSKLSPAPHKKSFNAASKHWGHSGYSSDSGYSASTRSPSSSPMPSPNPIRKFHSENLPGTSTGKSAFPDVCRLSGLQRHTKEVAVVVLRQPLGPNSSRGFQSRLS